MPEKTKTDDPDGKPEDSPEETDEVKSLTELLAEWPEESLKPAKADDGKPSESEQSAARLEVLERRADETDMAALVERVKGDLNVDNWMVRAWILNEAANDPKMDSLWDKRDSQQATLNKIVDDALIPGFKKYAEGKILPPAEEPDKKPEPSSKGLAAAARAARNADATPTGFDSVDWGSLSDTEFQTKKSEVFRAAKAGELK